MLLSMFLSKLSEVLALFLTDRKLSFDFINGQVQGVQDVAPPCCPLQITLVTYLTIMKAEDQPVDLTSPNPYGGIRREGDPS